MQKKKYRFNKDLDRMPSGFIMGDIKGVVMNPYNEVLEPGWIIGSGGEVAVITKDWERDSKSSGIMSVPSNEVWFETADGEYYDPMYVQVEEEQGDTFPDLPTFDREKTQAANTGSDHIYKWVFTEDVTRINDDSTGMFTEDNYDSAALPISKVFLPVNYWQNTSELEPYLFMYCSDLESFAIPNSVMSIGESAFAWCDALTSITIPNSVTSIGEGAFGGCSSLTAPVYNAHCFAYMPTSYSGAYAIPEGIKQIAGFAFQRCSSLTDIAIPNSVTSIGKRAFARCSSLTSVTIPNSVTSIGEGAFSSCTSLTSVTIGNNVTSIGDDAFSGCGSLTSITIGNSVTSIGGWAFKDCRSLISIVIPDGVTSIGGQAFSDCASLTSITIPESVTSIKGYAFQNTPWYNNLPDGIVYINSVLYKYKGSMPANTTIDIKAGTVSISPSAFSSCSSLTSITIPNNVTSIGDRTFFGCSSLTSITIPNSVTSIGDRAFWGCSSLKSITCEATTPPTLGSGNNLSNVTAVYVPAESVEAYKTATNWSYYSDKIQAIL